MPDPSPQRPASTVFSADRRLFLQKSVIDLHQRGRYGLAQCIACAANIVFGTIARCPGKFEPLLVDNLLGDLNDPETEIAPGFDLNVFVRYGSSPALRFGGTNSLSAVFIITVNQSTATDS